MAARRRELENMGHTLSYSRSSDEHNFFAAVQAGKLRPPSLPSPSSPPSSTSPQSALHIAAANGRPEVLALLVDQITQPDLVNRHKQTPLMLVVMHGKIKCVEMLLAAGTNILMLDSQHRRTCLHYAAYYGHSDCLQAILTAASSTPVADLWGFVRFANVIDANGATLLHLAMR